MRSSLSLIRLQTTCATLIIDLLHNNLILQRIEIFFINFEINEILFIQSHCGSLEKAFVMKISLFTSQEFNSLENL